ncbi:unnamed protein product [Urochloa humidicola]
MTVLGREKVRGGGRRPPAEVAGDPQEREHDINAGVEMGLKRAPTKAHPDQDQDGPKNRWPTKEPVALIKEHSFCLFCEKQIALPKGICMQCLWNFSEQLSFDSISRRCGEECADILEELEKNNFCTSCRKFTGLGHCKEKGHLTLTLAKIQGSWCLSVRKQDFWSPVFEDVQIFRSSGNVKWILLHHQSQNSCIGCSDSVSSPDVFCTFQCKELSNGTSHGWALSLLHEDFSQDCVLNMVRNTCPPTEFCSHCCLRHYLGKVEEKIEVLRQPQQAGEFKKNRFCIDCARSYSDEVCMHHIEHRTVGITYIDSKYKHCLVVPVSDNPWEATSAPFGAIQEVCHQVAIVEGYKVLPLKNCGSTKCLRCRRTVDEGVKWCSFDCID